MTSPERPPRFWRLARLVTLVLLLTSLGFLSVRSVAWDWYHLTSGAMEPTIRPGAHVLVLKAAYSLRVPFTRIRLASTGQPARGDIVVFRNPGGGPNPFIMRIVGLPGDRLELRDEVLVLNGVATSFQTHDSPRDTGGDQTVVATTRIDNTSFEVLLYPHQPAYRSFPEITVPPEEVFVLGDNRNRSRDSRFVGTIPLRDLLGRVVRVLTGA